MNRLDVSVKNNLVINYIMIYYYLFEMLQIKTDKNDITLFGLLFIDITINVIDVWWYYYKWSMFGFPIKTLVVIVKWNIVINKYWVRYITNQKGQGENE